MYLEYHFPGSDVKIDFHGVYYLKFFGSGQNWFGRWLGRTCKSDPGQFYKYVYKTTVWWVPNIHGPLVWPKGMAWIDPPSLIEGGGIKYEREEKRFSLILPQIGGGGEGGGGGGPDSPLIPPPQQLLWEPGSLAAIPRERERSGLRKGQSESRWSLHDLTPV